jgi:hypothetical protein
MAAAMAVVISASPSRASVEQSIQTVTKLGREGEGNEAATSAWREIVAAGPSALRPLLAALGRGSPVADNWLRVAGNAIVDEAQRDSRPLPLDELRAFLADTTHAGPGRLLAFDLLHQADRSQADALEPSLIHDQVQELRRGAVQRLIDAAKKTGEPAAAKPIYLQALEAVRDEDQTKVISAELKTLGVAVDLPKHFGFLMQWHIIGPFANLERAGYDIAFPPEREIDLDAEYEGVKGRVKWQPFTSRDDYGKLDFNKPLGMQKEVAAYAVTTFDSSSARAAELRLGCKNAWKIWLNGELLFGRDEYHRGQQIDQYKLKCQLKKGANTILVKCCQNEQKEEWTVEWEFQLRVCDSAGTPLPSGS